MLLRLKIIGWQDPKKFFKKITRVGFNMKTLILSGWSSLRAETLSCDFLLIVPASILLGSTQILLCELGVGHVAGKWLIMLILIAKWIWLWFLVKIYCMYCTYVSHFKKMRKIMFTSRGLFSHVNLKWLLLFVVLGIHTC